jgi:hypothetical protein
MVSLVFGRLSVMVGSPGRDYRFVQNARFYYRIIISIVRAVLSPFSF